MFKKNLDIFTNNVTSVKAAKQGMIGKCIIKVDYINFLHVKII